jgi:signal transduction histidine kinase
MTKRLSNDYRELKEYTDHTTHELQTPLAVIKTKMELLMQSDNLGPDEMQLIQAINASVNHLSRLNSTLALITRIENQQFTGKKQINLRHQISEQLEMLQELISLRDIMVECSYSDSGPDLVMDEGLADILIVNLLKNAVVHNIDGGRILIDVDEQRLMISNLGPPIQLKEEHLFRRFTRGARKTGSFGLGLSIVKKICDYYGFAIKYDYQDRIHSFTIRWQN